MKLHSTKIRFYKNMTHSKMKKKKKQTVKKQPWRYSFHQVLLLGLYQTRSFPDKHVIQPLLW